VTAGIVGLVAALAVGDPMPALIGAPMLVLAVVGFTLGSSPRIDVTIGSAPKSMVEGEDQNLELSVVVDEPIGPVHVDLGLGGFSIDSVQGGKRLGPSTVLIRRLTRRANLEVTLSAQHWGRSQIGPITVYGESPAGGFEFEYRIPETRIVAVVPDEDTLQALLDPIETNLHVGDLVSTSRGAGSEFADLRQFRLGDDLRTLNWRVSSRAKELWVNERHPERNGDVLLLVDAQVEPGAGMEALVDRSVRMAAALLHGHARRHHRLGLITLDGRCRWVLPGMGESHRRRLMEQLISIDPGQVLWETAERAITRTARQPSMVIALTPLMDAQLAGLIHSVRRSGVDISVVELDVGSVLPTPAGDARHLARRVWDMDRDRLRDRLIAAGVSVARWRSGDPPVVPLSELERWRTSSRRRLA
jgi:uncharacterized protein (DUF58 family)